MAPNANNEKGTSLRLSCGALPLFRVILLLSCVVFVVSSSLNADDGGGGSGSTAAAGDETRDTATPIMMTTATTKTTTTTATFPVPPRSWDTVQSMAQFFSSNLTGPYDPRAVEWIATNFGSVILDQWHDLRNPNRDIRGNTSQEDAILTELGRIKAVNPSVVTGLYVNTICYYPQYDLAGRVGVDDTNWLDVDGSRVQLGCSGCTPGPVPDWRRPSVARVFSEWARNLSSPSLPLPPSSSSFPSDGGPADLLTAPPPPPDLLFVDRVTDPVTHSGAVPNFTHLPPEDRLAFNRGKWNTLSSVDSEIIPFIGADVEGERPDELGFFRAGLVQFCVPGDVCLRRMRDCRLRGLICFVHVDYEKYGAVPSLATFLIGAYDGAYIVKGPWRDEAKEYGDQWKSDHVGPEWNEPLGRPMGPAQLVEVGGGPGSLSVYVRRFDSGTEVWLDGATGEARITWGRRSASSSSSFAHSR